MRKTTYLLAMSVIFASCSTSKKVVSNGFLHKRKYQKGVYLDFASESRKSPSISGIPVGNKKTNNNVIQHDEKIETPIILSNNYSAANKNVKSDEPILISFNNKSDNSKKAKINTFDNYSNSSISKISSLRFLHNIITPEQKNHPKAIWGWGLGMIGLFIFGLILGILAIIFSAQGLKEINQNPDKWTGKGYAIAGIILGIIDIIGWLILLLILLAAA